MIEEIINSNNDAEVILITIDLKMRWRDSELKLGTEIELNQEI